MPFEPDALLHPRGAAPPGVYWRRRLVTVGVLIVVLILLFKSCGADDTPASLTASRTPTPSVSASVPPVTTSGSSSPTTTGTPDCADADIKLEGISRDTVYEAGDRPRLAIRITNVSAGPCRRNIGPKLREVFVYSGTDRVWSVDDCTDVSKQADNITVLQPNKPQEFETTWSRRRSDPKDCSSRPEAKPGTYRVVVKLGPLETKGDSFSLRGPTTQST